ncbi:MAG: hypothetical protein GYB65_01720 [Chloroflexi bacterium]|nr:hypothetical protein [Chloroflexota bacterium]
MDWAAIGLAIGIFMLRVVGNMITTVRLVTLVRGQRLQSTVLAAFEALIFALAMGSVVTNLGNILNLASYSLGYAAGGYLGMVLEHRLIQRFVQVTMVSPQHAHQMAQTLREAGFGATELWGQGAGWSGYGSLTTVVGHQDVRQVIKTAQKVDPDVFVTLEELTGITRGYFRRIVRHKR